MKDRAIVASVLTLGCVVLAAMWLPPFKPDITGPQLITALLMVAAGAWPLWMWLGPYVVEVAGPESVGEPSQMEQLRARVTELKAKQADGVGLAERLQDLRAKMVDVGADVYGSRIPVVERAIALLDQEQANNQRLITEYERAIKVFEIEQEAAGLAEVLPVADAGDLVARLAELKVMEESNEDLRRQLQANEEVRGLVR